VLRELSIIGTASEEMNAKTRVKSMDGFKRGHTMARVIGVAIVLGPILVWFAWRDPGEVMRTTTTTGTVLEYQKPIALLSLANGEHVRVYVGPHGAKPGDKLPLFADAYSHGTVQYRVDLKALAVQPKQKQNE
jgi:hypothetical protein